MKGTGATAVCTSAPRAANRSSAGVVGRRQPYALTLRARSVSSETRTMPGRAGAAGGTSAGLLTTAKLLSRVTPGTPASASVVKTRRTRRPASGERSSEASNQRRSRASAAGSRRRSKSVASPAASAKRTGGKPAAHPASSTP